MGKMVVPLGPQHPALEEPESFSLLLEGERVAAAAVALGLLAKIWFIGSIIAAATAITSGVAGLLYAVEYNKTGKRSHILDKGSKRLSRGS